MEKIEFINTRYNPDLTPFHDLAKQMAKVVGYTANMLVELDSSNKCNISVKIS